MAKQAKLRHCFFCGEEIGFYADYDQLDTCGKRECEREAQIEAREIAQEENDWDCGGDFR
jgi:hypothetical protein